MYFGEDLAWLHPEQSTGTTIVAVKYDDGVILGADSRTSCGFYVANRLTDKLTRITDKIYCCRSGSAADTQSIADLISFYLDYQQNMTSEPATVKNAAQEFATVCYNNRGVVLASVIIAGWDQLNGGQIYSVALGGMLNSEAIAIGGSGSQYIYGFIKEFYRDDMGKEDCIGIVQKAIKHAIQFDNASGGVVRIGIINEDGIERRVYYNTPNGKSVVKSRNIPRTAQTEDIF